MFIKPPIVTAVGGFFILITMIDIIKESELKPIVLSDLEVDKLFVFYVKCSWNNNYIYTITKIDEERLYFKDTSGNYTESSIPLAEVDKYIILLSNYADKSTKAATNYKNMQDATKAFAEAQAAYHKAEAERTKLIRDQQNIHNKTKEFSRVLRYADKIKLFMDAALVYYEAENLSFRVVDDSFLEMATKFPDITITNSKKKFHKIKDLLVYTTINLETMKLSKGIEGYRGSVTPEEAYSNYNHSHLRSSNYNRITEFCLGSSEMAVLVAEMKSQVITPQKFEFYCGSLDQYVRWESLEGTPHIPFDNVSGNSNTLSSLRSTTKDLYYSKYLASKIPFKLTYEPINEKFKVTIDPNDVMALLPASDNDIRVIKKEGQYCSISNNTSLERDARANVAGRNSYYFDGIKKPELYIPEAETKEVKYYPHPELITYIQTKLEEEAEKHLILTQ